jgi:hypothetical protein
VAALVNRRPPPPPPGPLPPCPPPRLSCGPRERAQQQGAGPARAVSPAEAAGLIAGGARYLDVQTPEEFTELHAAGATNVPLQRAAPGGAQPRLAPGPCGLALWVARALHGRLARGLPPLGRPSARSR